MYAFWGRGKTPPAPPSPYQVLRDRLEGQPPAQALQQAAQELPPLLKAAPDGFTRRALTLLLEAALHPEVPYEVISTVKVGLQRLAHPPDPPARWLLARFASAITSPGTAHRDAVNVLKKAFDLLEEDARERNDISSEDAVHLLRHLLRGAGSVDLVRLGLDYLSRPNPSGHSIGAMVSQMAYDVSDAEQRSLAVAGARMLAQTGRRDGLVDMALQADLLSRVASDMRSGEGAISCLRRVNKGAGRGLDGIARVGNMAMSNGVPPATVLPAALATARSVPNMQLLLDAAAAWLENLPVSPLELTQLQRTLVTSLGEATTGDPGSLAMLGAALVEACTPLHQVTLATRVLDSIEVLAVVQGDSVLVSDAVRRHRPMVEGSNPEQRLQSLRSFASFQGPAYRKLVAPAAQAENQQPHPNTTVEQSDEELIIGGVRLDRTQPTQGP